MKKVSKIQYNFSWNYQRFKSPIMEVCVVFWYLRESYDKLKISDLFVLWIYIKYTYIAMLMPDRQMTTITLLLYIIIPYCGYDTYVFLCKLHFL